MSFWRFYFSMSARRKDSNGNEILTRRESLFVALYVENGNKGAQAARDAGYAEDSAGITASQKLNKPIIQAAIRERQRGLVAALSDVAWKLVGIIPDKMADAKLGEVTASLDKVIEKMQLLANKPTGINENRNANTDESFKSFFELLKTQGLTLDESTARQQFDAMREADKRAIS